jgi:hypothetical protein
VSNWNSASRSIFVISRVLMAFVSFSVLAKAGRLEEPPSSLVFHTQKIPTGCRWVLLDPHTHKQRTLYETPECPEKIIWDSRHQQTFYTLDESPTAPIYRTSWQNAATPVSLGPRGDLVDLWISRDSGRLRRVVLIETTPRNTLSMGSTNYFQYKGGKYPIKDPGLGIDGMAVVEEENESGEWRVIGASSTNWGACDTLGTLVVRSLMEKDPLTVTLQELLHQATCEARGCPTAPEPIQRNARQIFSSLKDRDDLAFDPLGADEGLLFPIVGDTVHGAGPVYYCRQQCQETNLLVPGSSQQSISKQASCALITEEYSGDNALVVCSGSSTQPFVLTDSHSAVWFPLLELWLRAKSDWR